MRERWPINSDCMMDRFLNRIDLENGLVLKNDLAGMEQTHCSKIFSQVMTFGKRAVND